MENTPQTVHLHIDGMSCGHCVKAVTKALESVPGLVIKNVAVGEAEATIPSNESLAAAIKAIDDVGFKAPRDVAFQVNDTRPELDHETQIAYGKDR